MVVVNVARREAFIMLVSAMVGCACVALTVQLTPKLIPTVVPVPGSHITMPLPHSDGCTEVSSPDGPIQRGTLRPARLWANISTPDDGADGVAVSGSCTALGSSTRLSVIWLVAIVVSLAGT